MYSQFDFLVLLELLYEVLVFLYPAKTFQNYIASTRVTVRNVRIEKGKVIFQLWPLSLSCWLLTLIFPNKLHILYFLILVFQILI